MSRFEKHGSTFVAIGCAVLVALLMVFNASC